MSEPILMDFFCTVLGVVEGKHKYSSAERSSRLNVEI